MDRAPASGAGCWEFEPPRARQSNTQRKAKDLYKIYQTLFAAFGPQHWWPARTRFEVIVGAILTQNTTWLNVEKAIENLRKARLLNLKALAAISTQKLYPFLRPTGYYRIKARRLKATIDFLFKRGQGNLNRFFSQPLEQARKELLSVKGIGPETADSILLYAGKKPIFVIDAYTRRIFERLKILQPGESYEHIQKLFMTNLSRHRDLYNEYHALIVRLGKEVCKNKPLCKLCPLSY